MSAIKRGAQEKAREMRVQGQSVNEIAKALNVSKGSVSVWVRDIEITSDQRKILDENRRANAIYLQRGGPGGKPFSEVNHQKGIQRRILYQQAGREYAKRGERLHRMGCILYWAEGAKTRNSVIFVNSDPNMMILFMRFLRECLNVPDEWLKLRLHCHTSDITEHERMKKYWLDLLRLKNDCFNQVIFLPSSRIRYNQIVNGLCTICVYNTEVTMHIYGAIQEYIGIDKPEWLFEKGVRS
jgi:hypothetical protein